MNQVAESSHVPRPRSPRLRLAVDVRRTSPGEYHHTAIAEHQISVHAGPPVRISCKPTGLRCVRSRGEINVLPAGITEEWFEDDPTDMVALRVRQSAFKFGEVSIGNSWQAVTNPSAAAY